MSGEWREPDYVKLGELLRRFRERMSPEVKQAVLTILDALFEEPPQQDTRKTWRQCTSVSKGARCIWPSGHAAHYHRSADMIWTDPKKKKPCLSG